jgi:hypothetical protein
VKPLYDESSMSISAAAWGADDEPCTEETASSQLCEAADSEDEAEDERLYAHAGDA